MAAPPEAEESEASTLEGPGAGRVLGDRYQVRELLGRGGMGEVYRAFDLKLRVDVALKAVRAGRLGPSRATEMLRREVRAARAVVSPNVCRVFDLVEEDGQEYVSMEFVDGKTLGEVLKERGPLALRESREIASQFLSGLSAIHEAGLVHRDFKPENVMVTRAGRVVVMDFGLAKGAAEGRTGTVAGTPAYMAPEQARGEAVDARADVFAAAVVLAEMVSVGGRGASDARQALWRGVRETPPRVPEGPWAAVLRQCLSPDPGGRPASPRELSRALEEVTLRLPGFEEKRPYPGLSSFAEEDAEYFFGREMETEAVFRKLKRPRLLALIGPSGAGKSSFLRAGLLPALPSGWTAVVLTPGNRPSQSLAHALVPAFSGDTGAMQEFLRFEEEDTAVTLVSRWRRRHEHALLIVDQFEELFTLNPEEAQARFAGLLGRLVLEADVLVLLSLRDDFLFRCHAHAALDPILSDLTLLGPIGESGLRRALVQPALSCGYRFEDEALVEEMVREVVKERGALPLLAFAASRLWEKRDRDRGLLTREAYREIGGVAGALAQHAEATLERIGTQRLPMVRELLRNLVSSQGTRAVRERADLLSVFSPPHPAKGRPARETKAEVDSAGTPSGTELEPRRSWTREDAGEVLDALVDARLLTSYERAGEGGESHQQVEIIHESLLQAWPRLVRWQTQDADGAQLRDQLRQAAQAWQDRGRPEGLLWSGTAYRDFALWRERYPGGLTATEEAFADAAAHRAGRRRRRRRLTVAAVVASLSIGLGVVATLWSRSETSRQRALAEARRAEASQLRSLAQLELGTDPSAALAYVLKSLELADSQDGRLFALRVLQRGPAAIVAPTPRGVDGAESIYPAFSPSGEWLAVAGLRRVQLQHRDGQDPQVIGDYPEPMGGSLVHRLQVGFGPDSNVLVVDQSGDVGAFAVPGGRELWRAQRERGLTSLFMRGGSVLTLTTEGDDDVVRRWALEGGEPRLVGRMPTAAHRAANSVVSYHAMDVDAAGQTLVYAGERRVELRSLEHWESPPRLLFEQPDVTRILFRPGRPEVAASIKGPSGPWDIQIWTTIGRTTRPIRVLRGAQPVLRFDASGRWLAAWSRLEADPVQLWDLEAPPGAGPVALRRSPGTGPCVDAVFHPSMPWLVTTYRGEAALWSLAGSNARVLGGHENAAFLVRFAADGRSVISESTDGSLREWRLGPEGDEPYRILRRGSLGTMREVYDVEFERIVREVPGGLEVEALAGGRVLKLGGFSRDVRFSFAFAPGGRRLAAGGSYGPREDKVVRIWDLDTGGAQVLGPVPGAGAGYEGSIESVHFLDQHRLLTGSRPAGVLLFDLRDGSMRVLAAKPEAIVGVSRNREFGIGLHTTSLSPPRVELVRFGLNGEPTRAMASHGDTVTWAALDVTDTWVASASADGTVRIGRASGEEPHHYFGHQGAVNDLAFSPDGQWLVSAGEDKTIRLWPVPDPAKPPLQTLPREVLLARLGALTNLRAVPDPASPSGYKVDVSPFPGWARVPER